MSQARDEMLHAHAAYQRQKPALTVWPRGGNGGWRRARWWTAWLIELHNLGPLPLSSSP
jgi:hypothetical protein